MTVMVEASNLKKRYGDKQAVDGVSFSVEKGEIFGILGPNGAGKTTTLEMMETLRSIDRGQAFYRHPATNRADRCVDDCYLRHCFQSFPLGID